MKFLTRTHSKSRCADRRRQRRGFTLAEVLAALVFMAIVIPVAVHGLQIASRAGTVAQRKALAARVAERVLNEITVTHQFTQAQQRGTVNEGPYEFRYTTRMVPWEQEAMRLVTVEVAFAVQGQDYFIRLNTLMDNSQL